MNAHRSAHGRVRLDDFETTMASSSSMDLREELLEELERMTAEWKVEDEQMRQRMQEAKLLNDAARAESDCWRETIANGAMLARETPPPDPSGGLEERLDRLERTLTAVAQDVGQLKQDVGQLSGKVDGLVTKVEFEGFQHAVKVMADGYQQTQRRLDNVAELLKRHLTA